MAASHLPWPTDHPEYAEKRYDRNGAELLSIEPWNTAADGTAACEDMPRKSIGIRLSCPAEKGHLRSFPAFRRGQVRAEPVNGSRDWSLVGS